MNDTEQGRRIAEARIRERKQRDIRDAFELGVTPRFLETTVRPYLAGDREALQHG